MSKMGIPPSLSETPSPLPTSIPGAEESHVSNGNQEPQAGELPQVGFAKATKTAETRQEGDKIIDCPGDLLQLDGQSVDHNCDLFNEANGYKNLSSTTEKERRKQAVLRLAQSKAYAELIEERIVLLEKSVADLQPKDGKALTDTEDEDKDTVAPKSHARISVMGWDAFRATFVLGPANRGHRPEWDSTRKSVIEILRDEPILSNVSISCDNEPMSHPRTTEQIAHSVDFDPHQIRVRSKLLLQVLNEITGCNTTLGQWKHKILFIRPFKLLVYFNKCLRVRLKDLEELHSINHVHDVSVHCRVNNHDRIPRLSRPVKETESVEARDQLKRLCETVDTYLQPQVLLHGSLSADSPKVEFHELWYIFKPGCEVRTRDPYQTRVYRVLNVTGGRPLSTSWRSRLDRDSEPKTIAARKLEDQGYSPGSFLIECLYIHFDGLRYGPVNATFQIRKFDGKKDITSLPIFPLACDRNEPSTRERLLKRGQKFATLSNTKAASHRKYKGLTLDKTQEMVDSEIIVDFPLALMQLKGSKPTIGIGDLIPDDSSEYQLTSRDGSQDVTLNTGHITCWDQGCCGNDIIHPDYDVDEKARKAFADSNRNLLESFDSPEQLTLDHKILLPPCVYGFVLRTRKWATFDIDLVSRPEYGNGWDQLVIDKDTKSTVLALVDNHERPRDNSGPDLDGVLSCVDLVQGKGKGLIILLHGEPGVGKTSTAECVAAHTKRPLFPITCGDIGHLAEDVEANLEQNFQLAHKWRCVLLLDEADIFLSSRTNDDIQRNAIVSVFLRSLEYYSGILFLTTNRVGKIDTAFKSRIHLSLYYKRLDKRSTLQIWENNLKRVRDEFAKENKEILANDPEIMKFAASHYKKLKKSETLRVWNGRQIRNSFQTAIAIATYEAREKNDGHKLGSRDRTGHHVESLPLSVAHFEKVAKSARQFDHYLIGLHRGMSESGLAHDTAVRYDDFEDPGSDRDLPKEKRRRRKARKPSKTTESSCESSSDEEPPSSSSSSSDSDASEHKHKKKKRRR